MPSGVTEPQKDAWMTWPHRCFSYNVAKIRGPERGAQRPSGGTWPYTRGWCRGGRGTVAVVAFPRGERRLAGPGTRAPRQPRMLNMPDRSRRPGPPARTGSFFVEASTLTSYPATRHACNAAGTSGRAASASARDRRPPAGKRDRLRNKSPKGAPAWCQGHGAAILKLGRPARSAQANCVGLYALQAYLQTVPFHFCAPPFACGNAGTWACLSDVVTRTLYAGTPQTLEFPGPDSLLACLSGAQSVFQPSQARASPRGCPVSLYGAARRRASMGSRRPAHVKTHHGPPQGCAADAEQLGRPGLVPAAAVQRVLKAGFGQKPLSRLREVVNL